MKEKAALIKVAVSNGLTDLDLIKNKYNEFAEGGNTKSSDKEYYSYMEKLATKKAKDWGEHPDITLTHMLNSNDYNYRAFYDNNRESALAMLNADPEAHFTDVGKTVYHPTFSNESIYSGKKSDYNPRGTIGGSWNGLEYVPSKSQLKNKDFNYNKTKKYLTNTPEYIDSKYNKFDEGGITTTDAAKTVASFIPFVGTGLDIYDFAKDPSIENGLWALASLGTDLYSVGQGSKAVRAAKLARQAQKAHDIAKMKHLDSVVRRGNKNYTNNLRQFRKQRDLSEQSRQLASSHIKNAIKAELIQGLAFNTAQQGYNNKEVLLDMVNNPQNYLNSKALGGSLLNQNNPIESFNGGRRLPIVRYDEGGTLNENTNVNVTEEGNKVIYDFSQNEDINNPGYLGNETYDVGVLPNIEVKASTNSARSNRAYRNWLQKQEQQEFNNYIREGTNKFAKPLQYGFLGAMALPVASGALSGMGAIDTYLASKVPYYTVGKSVLEGVGTAYEVGTRVNDIVTEGKYQPYADFKEGNYGNAALGLGFDFLTILGGVDAYKNNKYLLKNKFTPFKQSTIKTPSTINPVQGNEAVAMFKRWDPGVSMYDADKIKYRITNEHVNQARQFYSLNDDITDDEIRRVLYHRNNLQSDTSNFDWKSKQLDNKDLYKKLYDENGNIKMKKRGLGYKFDEEDTHGAEANVFILGDKVYKIQHHSGEWDVSGYNEEDMGSIILKKLRQNRLGEDLMAPYTYEGYIKDPEGLYRPIFSQELLKPMPAKRHTLFHNDDVFIGESAHDKRIIKNFKKRGIKPTSEISGNTHNGYITSDGIFFNDASSYNMGYDKNGNLKIFDPYIVYNAEPRFSPNFDDPIDFNKGYNFKKGGKLK